MRALFAALPLAASAAAPPGASITVDDPRVQYTGRFDASEAGVRRFSWAASQVGCAFTGTSAAATLSGSDDRFLAVVDGEPSGYTKVKSGKTTVTVASGLAAGNHTLNLWKVTEDNDGPGSGSVAAFHGFSLPDGGAFAAPPARPARRLEIIGDSDAAGWCADGSPDTGDKAIKFQDTYQSWGAQIARAVGAEIHVQAVSGIGVMTKVSRHTMGDILDNVVQFGEVGGKWNYTQWTPDAVVILIGPNDVSGEKVHSKLVKAYLALLEQVAGNYGAASVKPQIISICGGSLNGLDPCASIQDAHSQFSVPGFSLAYASITRKHWNEINAKDGGSPYNGCDGHYNAKGHAVLVGDVLPTIKKALGW